MLDFRLLEIMEWYGRAQCFIRAGSSRVSNCFLGISIYLPAQPWVELVPMLCNGWGDTGGWGHSCLFHKIATLEKPAQPKQQFV